MIILTQHNGKVKDKSDKHTYGNAKQRGGLEGAGEVLSGEREKILQKWNLHARQPDNASRQLFIDENASPKAEAGLMQQKPNLKKSDPANDQQQRMVFVASSNGQVSLVQ